MQFKMYSSIFQNSVQFWKSVKKFIRAKAFGKLNMYRVNKGIYKVYLSVHSKALKKVEIYLQALVAKGWGH